MYNFGLRRPTGIPVDLDTAPWHTLKCLHHLTTSGGKDKNETLGERKERGLPLVAIGFRPLYQLTAIHNATFARDPALRRHPQLAYRRPCGGLSRAGSTALETMRLQQEEAQ